MTSQAQTDHEFLTAKETADLLRTSQSTLRTWVYRLKIPHRKHGKRLIFNKLEVMSWSEKQKVDAYDDDGNVIAV